jgi:hypothetical protein
MERRPARSEDAPMSLTDINIVHAAAVQQARLGRRARRAA